MPSRPGWRASVRRWGEVGAGFHQHRPVGERLDVVPFSAASTCLFGPLFPWTAHNGVKPENLATTNQKESKSMGNKEKQFKEEPKDPKQGESLSEAELDNIAGG